MMFLNKNNIPEMDLWRRARLESMSEASEKIGKWPTMNKTSEVRTVRLSTTGRRTETSGDWKWRQVLLLEGMR
jgi:hypothetical protein